MHSRPLDSVYNHLEQLAQPSPTVSPSNSFPSQASVPILLSAASNDDPPLSPTTSYSSRTASLSSSPEVHKDDGFSVQYHQSLTTSSVHSFLSSRSDHPQRMSGLSAFGNGGIPTPRPSLESHSPISVRSYSFTDYPPSSCDTTPIDSLQMNIPSPLPITLSYSRQSISTAPSSPSVATHLTGLSTARLNPPVPVVDLENDNDISSAESDDLAEQGTNEQHMQLKNAVRQPINGLPEPALWLLAIVVELWIDQEGFRAVKPEFILSRYFRSRTNDPAKSIAEFTPRLRQGYHFHYAPFDAPPVLRRLTLNGSQTYDHISRQAQLVLKTNGVYFVQGEEDKGQLRWKFEYIVDDRRGRSGKILNGEKVLIPLGFTCSPELLSPEHGRKIKLLHEVRKRVVPKLTSLKLKLPVCDYPRPIGLSTAKSKKESESTVSSDDDDYDTPHGLRARTRAFSASEASDLNNRSGCSYNEIPSHQRIVPSERLAQWLQLELEGVAPSESNSTGLSSLPSELSFQSVTDSTSRVFNSSPPPPPIRSRQGS